jgi:hypothetical protein
MRKKLLVLGCFTTTVLILSINSLGCSCDGTPNPPCRAYWYSPAVFSGIVTAIRPFELSAPGQLKVSIKVEQAYKGVGRDQVEVLTGDGQTADCGFPFEVGQRYLVYADNYNDILSTTYCTRTRDLSRAQDDLDYIEKLPSMLDGIRIFGNITKRAKNSMLDEKPVANLPVRITDLSRGRIESLKTDTRGNFKKEGIPAGSYLIEALFPKGIYFYAYGQPEGLWSYQIPNKGCAEVNFATYFEGKIQGRVLSETGVGVGGYRVQLISADYEFKSPTDTAELWDWEPSADDGSFVFDGLPPGRYKVGIGIGGAADVFMKKGRIFYPNTLDPMKAKVITVREGRITKDISLAEPKKPL